MAEAVDALLAEVTSEPWASLGGRRWVVADAAVSRLAALGDGAVPVLIARVEQVTGDETRDTPEDVCLRALVAIGTEASVGYVLERASRVARPGEPDGPDGQIGVWAIDALTETTDPRAQEQLVQWVVSTGDGRGWDPSVLWHLIDAAAPFLDERAVPTLELLAQHGDIQDTAPAARAALDRLGPRRNTRG